jgi:glucosamine-6-phosphate deaminase
VEVVITTDADGAAELVAGVIVRVLRSRPAPVLGLATGGSPLPTYQRLIAAHARGEVSFAHASAVLLDEYVGLPPGHPEGYRAFICRELVDHIDLAHERLFGPDVFAPDLADACRRYDELIADLGGVDVQLLGIGSDGHIGFNEPGSSLASRTRIKTLTHATRADNARFFDDDEQDVPRHVVTQGLGTILEARHLLLVACGAGKAEPIARAVEGPVTAMCPASILQLHPHATVVVDEPAAAKLELADYYREAFRHKPPWQQL